MSLKLVLDVLNEINSTSSRLEKESIISKYVSTEIGKKLNRVVRYALDPYKKYNVREIEYITKAYQTADENILIESIFDFLDTLSKKRGATDSEKDHLSKLSSIDPQTVEVVQRIITGDLKCGASIKTFRKFFKDIPKHEVMLCQYSTDDLERFIKVSGGFQNIIWSNKLNGVRCWCEDDGNEKTYISRNGIEYPNFNILDNELNIFNKLVIDIIPNSTYPLIIDGEVISKDKRFQKMMTQLRRLKDIDPSQFEYHVFDLVLPQLPFFERYNILQEVFENNSFKRIKLVEHWFTEFSSINDILAHVNNICIDEKGDLVEEGIVMKVMDSPYEFKRSAYWCKVKPVFDADVEVLGFEFGKSGTKYENSVGKLVCLFNGKEFRVGSGLTDEEREEFLEDTPELIEIEYSQLSEDGIPLFPRFIRVREDK